MIATSDILLISATYKVSWCIKSDFLTGLQARKRVGVGDRLARAKDNFKLGNPK